MCIRDSSEGTVTATGTPSDGKNNVKPVTITITVTKGSTADIDVKAKAEEGINSAVTYITEKHSTDGYAYGDCLLYTSYREFLKDKGYEDRDIVDVLNDQYYDWEIITSIEKKNADGTYETVWKSTDDDKADLAGGAFATAEKGTYRVVKDLYSGNSGLLFYRFSVFSNEVNTAQQNNVTPGTDKPNNGSNSNTNGGNNGNSANPGNTAVKKPAKVKKVTAKMCIRDRCTGDPDQNGTGSKTG